MSAKTSKIIIIILFVLSIICFFAGVGKTRIAMYERELEAEQNAHEITNIQAELTRCERRVAGSKQLVILTFAIENNTEADLATIDMVTYIYDRNGTAMGTITSRADYSESATVLGPLAPGETRTYECQIEDGGSYYQRDAIFEELYQNGLSSVSSTTKIEQAKWSDGYYGSSETSY